MLIVSRTANTAIIIHAVYILMKHGVQMTKPHNCLIIYLCIVKLCIDKLRGSFSKN